MARPRKPVGAKADAAAIRARLKDKTLAGWQRQRLQVALLGLGEKLLPEIARECGVHPRTVSTWLETLRSGGLATLLSRKPKAKGPQSWLDEQSAAAFKSELQKGQWRRAEDARRWLEEKLGRQLSLFVVYKYLGKCAARLKVPRPHHAKQNPAAVETFRTTLCAQLHATTAAAAASAAKRPVHIWVVDEMRFGLQPVTRKAWTLRGTEIKAPVSPRYQWAYTWGALEVLEGGSEFLHTDSVCQEATAVFYEQIASSDGSALHVIIADGAGFHLPAGHPLLPPNVQVITLPAYSPELNPVEKLWDIIKDRICNRVWVSLDELENAIDGVLREYWSSPERPLALVSGSVIRAQANASIRSILVA